MHINLYGISTVILNNFKFISPNTEETQILLTQIKIFIAFYPVTV